LRKTRDRSGGTEWRALDADILVHVGQRARIEYRLPRSLAALALIQLLMTLLPQDYDARQDTTSMSRFASMGHGSHMTGIFVDGPSGQELAQTRRGVRDITLGLRVASPFSEVTPDLRAEDATMARSVSINRPRKRQPQRRHVEERPVLQLPLEPPAWREPPSREESREPTNERGVAVIDFFI
jgi:hypothetical protein